jgi:hypothetical protein
MEAMESCCYEKDGSKNSVSDGEVGVEVLVDLGECKGNAKCDSKEEACNSIFSRAF